MKVKNAFLCKIETKPLRDGSNAHDVLLTLSVAQITLRLVCLNLFSAERVVNTLCGNVIWIEEEEKDEISDDRSEPRK
jgi:hypothetical protein